MDKGSDLLYFHLWIFWFILPRSPILLFRDRIVLNSQTRGKIQRGVNVFARWKVKYVKEDSKNWEFVILDEKSMKYSQLVHMPRDVKHWLEEQLEAHGIDVVVYTKYLLSLLQEENTPPVIDSKKKYLLENLVEELCIKLKEFESRDSSRFEFYPECKSDTLAMDPTHGFSYGQTKASLNCMEPIQPCFPPTSAWTRGLLHDSSSEIGQDKMEDYFSRLFYDNPTDVFGFDFPRNKSDDRKNVSQQATDRVNFYNRRNLLASDCSERLYERNTDIDKLIAKFDASVEDIWKTTSDADQLNMKYQSFLSRNFFPNPYLQYGSNFIWSFGENEADAKTAENQGLEGPRGEIPNNKSSFSHWNKFSSPVLSNSNNGFDAMLSSFNVTLSNMQKWSAVDSYNAMPNPMVPNEKIGSYYTEANAKESGLSGRMAGYVPEGSQNSQEEDLLTSAKTHFRPIRAEELAGSQTGIYADGTTFAISNDLEKVSFKRSESGTLYLEADADTPRKYMEYKEKEGGKDCGESDGSSLEEFVPKFRVRQNNEKCCQTDDVIEDEQMVPSMRETDCESVSSESEDEFYFPGDEELAQNIINAIEEETREEIQSEGGETRDATIEILEMSLYKTPERKQCICNNEKEWNATEKSERKQEWSEIWNSESVCDNCKNSEKLSMKDKFRFREELTQEGEQLLLDLSCLQQLYSNSDWCDVDSTTGSDSNDDEGGNSVEEVRSEWEIPTGDPGKGFGWWSWLIAKDEPVKNSFDLSRLWKEEKSLSSLLENDKQKKLNEKNERPLITDMMQTERKRRNSSSQKACNLYMEGQCRRPHCRFAHCDSAIPCPFFADASCTKGDSCPMSHGARRPISL